MAAGLERDDTLRPAKMAGNECRADIGLFMRVIRADARAIEIKG